MNYKECNKLLDLLNKGDLEKLRSYIEKEKTRYYLTNAREALRNYLRPSDYSFYKNYNGGLVLTNGISGYILNSDEILTDTYKNRMSSQRIDYIEDKVKILINRFNEYKHQEYNEVSKVESILPREVILYSEFDNYSYKFYKENYSYADSFLGDNISYYLLKNSPVCIAISPKGKGLILGMRKK